MVEPEPAAELGLHGFADCPGLVGGGRLFVVPKIQPLHSREHEGALLFLARRQDPPRRRRVLFPEGEPAVSLSLPLGYEILDQGAVRLRHALFAAEHVHPPTSGTSLRKVTVVSGRISISSSSSSTCLSSTNKMNPLV